MATAELAAPSTDDTAERADPGVTAEDLIRLFGPIPLSRIRFDVEPGTATEADMIRIHNAEDRICELIDGILVEKAVSAESSLIAGQILTRLNVFIAPLRIGFALGADGMLRLIAANDRLRAADVSFIHRDQIPGGRFPTRPIPELYPTLAVEVLSPSNTRREMEVKRADYFAAGTRVVWMVDPPRRTVEVFTAPDQSVVLTEADTLNGGEVLPGFTVPVAELFAGLEIGGPSEKPAGT